MSKLTKQDMEELRECCSYDCEYSGTEDIVQEITAETLEELGSDTRCPDEVGLEDDKYEFATLDDFLRIFWDKAVERILNVVESQQPTEMCYQGEKDARIYKWNC